MFDNYYNGTFRRLIVAFGTMFDGINITMENGKTVRVPVHYSQKEKFVEVLAQRPDATAPIKGISYPVLGYELIALNYAPERNKNQMHKIRDCTDLSTGKFMYNRVPYDVMFEVFFATKKLDDSFKIAEQILPNFAPGLTMKVKDIPGFDIENNLIIDLTSSSFTVEYDGEFDNVRHIMWQLSFTVKTYLYRNVNHSTVITKSVVDVLNGDDVKERELFNRYTANMDGSVTIEEGHQVPVEATP